VPPTGYYASYAIVALTLVVGVLFLLVAGAANRLLAPNAPSPGKSTTYECGIDPVGGDWAHTQVRYYVYAFLYVIFAVDAVYLFPWAPVLGQAEGAVSALVAMMIFLGVLATGIVHAARAGVLEWT
jgi:NADH-quinone oxidoreductase subunit A